MRKNFLIFFIVTISLIFTLRLFSLQILNPDFEKLSQNNAVLAISEYPERGLIFDRNKKYVWKEKKHDYLILGDSVVMDTNIEDYFLFSNNFHKSKNHYLN